MFWNWKGIRPLKNTAKQNPKVTWSESEKWTNWTSTNRMYCGLTGSWRMRLHMMSCISREMTLWPHLERVTSCRKSINIERCIFTWRTIRSSFSSIVSVEETQLKWHRFSYFREMNYGCHLESMTSYQKSDSVSCCIFTDPVWYDGALGFFEEQGNEEQEQNE